jgi:hypothetical protein
MCQDKAGLRELDMAKKRFSPEQFFAKYKDSEKSRKTPLLGGSVFG